MKKLIALFGLLLVVTSCDIDDDGPQYYTSYSEIVNVNLPEYFVFGETDTLEISYKLPTACHTGLGVQSNRGDGDERNHIYLAGVVSVDATITECTRDASEEDLIEVTEARIVVNERESYVFKLFEGTDVDNKPIYRTIEVPVQDEDDEDPEPEA